MLVNNLLELLTSKEKQLSVLSQIPSNNKKIGVTQKVEKNSLFFAESGVKSSIYYKQLDEPHFLLAPKGIPAQLCIPDEERAPLLVSDIKMILTSVLDPNLKDSTKMNWFKIHKIKLIPNTCLVIVDGITVSTFCNLNLGKKEIRRLHKKRLRKGLVSPFLGNYKDDEPQTIGKSNDGNCGEPPQKWPKQCFMTEVLNGLQTWLPQTSTLLPLKVEVVPPLLYGNSLLLDIFLIPLSSERRNQIQFQYGRKPKSLRLLYSDEVLCKQAKGEIMDSSYKAAETLLEQLETPYAGMSQSPPTILYYNQLAQRWDGSRGSACTPSFSHYWTKGTTTDIKLLKLDKFDRRCLLMNLEDMLSNNCPVHPNVHSKFASADCNDIDYSEFVGTKRTYIPVRSDSPLFALDCEFKQKKALDILSMVNECGQVVYRTDVAEANHHKYCSLIECTECRKPSIEDVQQHLIHYLPPDAILVGHSISSDLGALKMYHPYIIDTSLHFNFGNNIPSLSTLSWHFLGKVIQLKNCRHDPTEDALATLQVLQLKLQHSFTYGCRSLGGFVPSPVSGDALKQGVDKLYYWHLFEYLCQNKLDKVQKLHCRVCVVAEECFKAEWCSSLEGVEEKYAPTLLPDGGAVLEMVCTSLAKHDLSVAHIKAAQQINSDDTSERLDALATLDAQLVRVHASLPDKSLFAVLFINSNCEVTTDNVSNGIFMMGMKGKEQFILLDLSEDPTNNE